MARRLKGRWRSTTAASSRTYTLRIDADGGKTLAPPTLLPYGSQEWRAYSFECIADHTTRAASIVVRRQECTATPCLIYGRIWLDDFSLKHAAPER